MEEYFPIEKPKEKKDFSSSYAKIKEDKGKRTDDDHPKSVFQRIKDKDKDRHSQGLKDIKAKSSKNYQVFNKLNKLIEKDE